MKHQAGWALYAILGAIYLLWTQRKTIEKNDLLDIGALVIGGGFVGVIVAGIDFLRWISSPGDEWPDVESSEDIIL